MLNSLLKRYGRAGDNLAAVTVGDLGRLEDCRVMLENLRVGVYRSSIDGKQIHANPALVKLNGYDSEAELLAAVQDIGSEWYVDPGRRAEFMEILARDGFVENFVSEIYRHRTRERIWITETARLVCDQESGQPLWYEGTVQEITETKKRLEIEERFRKISSQLPGCVYQYRLRPDGTTHFPFVTDGLVDLFGVSPGDVMLDDRVMWSMLHPDDLETAWRTLRKSAEDLSPWSHDFRIVMPDGEVRWIHENAAPEREADGGVLWHGFMTELTERKRIETRIYKLAYFDHLTDLPNRKLLVDRLDQMLEEAGKDDGTVALLYIDLDGFKEVNDAFGHEVGDELLRAAAARFGSLVDQNGFVSRLGGDEFAIAIQGALAVRSAISLAQEINAFFAEPMVFGGRVASVGASIGMSKSGLQIKTAGELLRCADLAMYAAKASGRNRFCLYDRSLDHFRDERRHIADQLRTILADRKLEVLYQPIFDASTGAICGAEALLRWPRDEARSIPPDVFVPIAEQCGLIDELGRFVLIRACQQAVEWPGITISVNVSPLQLMNPAFPSEVARIMDETGLERGRLELDITESFIVENARRANVVLSELKALKIPIALDDFGSGFSSIGQIRKFAFNRLKIDRSMVKGIATNPSALKLLQATVGLAHALSMHVTVEGVEQAEDVPLLRLAGCQQLQGFLFSRPIEADALTRILRGESEQPAMSLLRA